MITRIGRDLWRTLPDLLLFDLLLKAALALVLVPSAVWLFRGLIASSGDRAVGNFDILPFLLTPRGVLAALLLGVVALIGGFLGGAGPFFIGYAALWDRRVTWLEALRLIGRHGWHFLEASLLAVLAVAVVVAPFALAGFLVYHLLLSAHDINYYLATRPAELKTAALLCLALAAGAALFAVTAYLAVVFALPNVLFRGDRVWPAFRLSWRLVRRHRRLLVLPLVGWPIAGWIGSALINALFWQLGRSLAASAGRQPEVLAAALGLLLVLHVVLAAILGFLFLAVNSLLIVQLYREVCRRASIPLRPIETGSALGDRPSWHLSGKLRLAAVAVALVAVVAIAYGLLEKSDVEDRVEITAHRGSSLAAPENTLAAIDLAIEEGADFVEIDVQLTADGSIVVAHDADLMRVARDPRVITRTPRDELRDVDVGSWFDSVFADQRLPTLDEVIDLVRGRARLDVEIKSYGADGKLLTAEVVETLRSGRMVDDAVIMSLKYAEVREARRLAPEIPVGFVASAAIGRLADLDVDFLAVPVSRATGSLIATAHAQETEVWVWTVDDPRVMSRLIDRGVDNVITNTPATMRDVLAARAELDSLERILLRFSNLYVN
jgi:glycerophosphoryl diester phosphodiesterase